MDLIDLFAKDLLQNQEYAVAQKYIAMLHNADLARIYLTLWKAKGNKEEQEYFICRFVILY